MRELEQDAHSDASQDIVAGLIPSKSINIAVGDSGLGKSPFAYQLGLCVATGVPFLGHSVSKGTVLYVDLENGNGNIITICRSLEKYLKLSCWPENFFHIISDHHLHQIENWLKDLQPKLVIIDSLRAFRPDAEENNRNAAIMMNRLKKLAREFGVAFLLIHHVKKPGGDGPPSLEGARVMTWLNEACGARALINQSDVRIAFDVSASARRVAADRDKPGGEEIGLVVKGFARVRGEFGPLYLTRDYDAEGQPSGYRQMTGVDLLFNVDQQAAFGRLPHEFRFKEAKTIYRRRDQATSDFLQKCERVGIIKRLGSGRYLKIAESPELMDKSKLNDEVTSPVRMEDQPESAECGGAPATPAALRSGPER